MITTTTEASYKDKTTWSDGPWQQEPDRIYWIDEVTGLPCLIRRGPSGALCGYVAVLDGHPWHGKGYGDCLLDDCSEEGGCWEHSPDAKVSVHGGLTYAAGCDGDKAQGICHVPAPGQPDDAWWFGFDCAHSGDHSPEMAARYGRQFPDTDLMQDGEYRDVSYVRGEVGRLAEQLAAVAS